MNRTMKAVPMLFVAISFASVAWAGGAACSGTSQGASHEASAGKTCTHAQKASAAGDHCPMIKGAQEASGERCGVKANQAMLSYAVPSAECGHCGSAIQKAAMDLRGVTCAHVDLDNRVAYIIADKSVNRQSIAKAIQAAGFKCSFKAQGAKVEAAFAKTMTSAKGSDFCCAKKDKDKV